MALREVLVLLLTAILMLSVFAKEHKYKVKLTRVETIEHAKGYLSTSIRSTKYNKTLSVLNGPMYIQRDLNLKNMEFSLDSYQNVHNEYVKGPIRLQRTNMCTTLMTDKFVINQLFESFNTTKSCELKQGTIMVDNYYVEPNENWPDDLLGEKWRFDAKILDKGELVVEMRFYAEIDRTDMFRSKLGPGAAMGA